MVRIVLAEKGINYDVQPVDLNDTPEDLKDLNPYNEVPTLVDRDLVLYHHQVIMEYLDERFPHPPLMPVDPVSRGRNRLMLHRIERDWYSLADKINGVSKEADSARKELRDSLISAMPIFDSKPFFMSDELSLIDCAIMPLLWRLPHYGIQLPGSAKPLNKYMEHMFKRNAFKASLTEVEKDMHE
jgi:RNA polymerase-associated protein